MMLLHSIFGCAVCFGAADSPLKTGSNWGILLLLGVTGAVLFCFLLFMISLWRKSRLSRSDIDTD